MNTLFFVSALIQSSNEGFSLGDVLASLPTDPASLFALLLIVGVAGAVMWFGRPKGGA
ncbi:MAG: hypothetical protein WD995_01530 [Gemmatimonadota bacterium]